MQLFDSEDLIMAKKYFTNTIPETHNFEGMGIDDLEMLQGKIMACKIFNENIEKAPQGTDIRFVYSCAFYDLAQLIVTQKSPYVINGALDYLKNNLEFLCGQFYHRGVIED